MVPATTQRVKRNTSEAINRRIEEATRESVTWHAAHPQRIGARLKELDREWDTERVLEANAAIAALSGTILAFRLGERWLLLPALVTAFLFQHALQGWCPPLPVIRRLGFRTAREIENERVALKALRGDFAKLRRGKDSAAAALNLARL